MFPEFRNWKALVEKQTRHKLKMLRSDNSREYTSGQFEQYLKSGGIHPRCKSRKGLLGRSREHHSISQELESNEGSSRKNSFEAWYGKKPNVEHLKVFGCMAYVHIPKDERHKLDSKA